MHALASFVMRSRTQAAAIAALIGMLSLLIPPLGFVSMAVIALVTLRQGEREGLLTLLLASVACGLFGVLLIDSLAPVVQLALASWLPVVLLGALLRITRSLSLTLQVGLVFGLALIAAHYWQYQDPVAHWREHFQPFTQALVESGLIEGIDPAQLLDGMARWWTGLEASLLYLELVAALLLARWWQSLLYNPGGFRVEMLGLRMSRALGYVTLGLLVLYLALGVDWALVRYLLLMMVAVYAVQGLAIAHAMVARTGVSAGWLVGVYVLLVIATLYAMVALAATGLADTWLNFRSGSGRGGGSRQGPSD
jgi:hypothetical protein